MSFPEIVPTLSAAGVTLRAHHAGDLRGVVEQCHDPLSLRWTTVPIGYTEEQAWVFVGEAMPRGWAEGSEWGFAVEALDDTGTPRFAGTVSLRNEGDGRAEVAYGSHPWVRGRGVMETALRLLLDWGFSERGLRTVVWWANKGNWASRRLAWRVGFTVEGTVRRWLPQRGVLLDGWVGTLLAGDPRRPTAPWYAVPRLVGEQVVLRPHRDDDVGRIVETCRDPVAAGWIGSIPQPYARQDAEEWLESRKEEHATGGGVNWAVADARNGLFLGNISLFGVSRGHDAELGYLLHPDARGRGVATEACLLAQRHAFVPEEDGGLGLGRVHAYVAEGNVASQRVLEKAGLVQCGRGRRMIRVGGGAWADAVAYDNLAEEFRVK